METNLDRVCIKVGGNKMSYTNIKKSLSSSYDSKSKQRNESLIQDWKVEERDHFYSLLVKEEKISLLEIGAGPGKDGLFFNERGLKTLSTDLSEESVALCQEKGLNAKVMSFDHLTLPDNEFDAVWALNCLLHVPKQELEQVLMEIKRVLKPGGLFYMGVYGGRDSEGIWEDDFYEPKRFFSFYEDEKIKEVVANVFEIEGFRTISKEIVGGELDFQSIILRK